MDAKDAGFAIREWMKPRFAIPMHYGANPLGKGRPEDFVKAVGSGATQVLQLRPGEGLVF